MKRWIIIVVIMGLLIVVWRIASRLQKAGKELSRLVPAEAIVYAELQGMESVRDIILGTHSVGNLEIFHRGQNDSLNILIQTLRGESGFNLDENATKDLLGGRIAFALLYPGEKGDRTLLTIIGSRDRNTKNIIKKMRESPHRYCNVEKYGGNDVYIVKKSSPISVAYTFVKDCLIFSFSGKQDYAALKQVIDLACGRDGLHSLAEDSTYNYSRNYADFSEAARSKMEFHIVLDAWDALVEAYPILPIDYKWFLLPYGTFGRRIQDALTKRLKLHYILAGQLILDPGITLKFFLEPNNERQERYYDEKFSPISTISPRVCSSVNLIPSGSMFYLVFQTEVPFYWERRKADWLNLDPYGARKFFCAVQDWERELSLDLQEDCFSWMGREMAFAVEEADDLEESEFPGITLLFEVKDKNKAIRFLHKLGSRLVDQSEVDGNFKNETYSGVEVTSLSLASPNIQPSFAFLREFLVMTTSRKQLRKIIDVDRGGARSLKSDPVFQEVTCGLDPPPAMNEFLFVNLEQVSQAASVLLDSWTRLKESEYGRTEKLEEGIQAEEYVPLLALFHGWKAVAFEKQQLDDAFFGRIYCDIKEK